MKHIKMKIILIDGKQYDLMTIAEAFEGIDTLEPRRCYIEIGSRFYPVSFNMGNAYNVPPKHGVYILSSLLYVPVDDGTPQWNLSNYQIIDFNNMQTISDAYNEINKMSELAKETLIPSSDDEINKYEITNEQTNLLKALLMFVNSKEIVCRRYADRFDNYPNTIRILKKKNISIDKFMEFINNMDGKATITIENADDDVANPIPKPIVIEL